ncbi:MAG: DUF4190 domain-containing protein [Actinomycetota bacterium]|nr:DUF4190 domain-containing protein [Actinomycetota bacterium]
MSAQRPDSSAPAAPQAAATNGKAIASLIVGILLFGALGGIIALVLGYSAKNEIDRSGGAQSGRGLAVAGIVIGWLGVVSTVIAIIVVIALVAS